VAGADVYPITSPTYVLLRPTYTDAKKGAAVKAYFTWLLTDGSSLYATNNYAALPDSLVQKALTAIAGVSA
jgi:phosphate transport system substrate-binding protein